MVSVRKVAIYSITRPEQLRHLSDAELLNVHRRLHQIDAVLRRGGRAREYLTINRHVWVVEEMQRRGFAHHIVDELDEETMRLLRAAPLPWLAERLSAAEEILLVPHYVSLVGSAVEQDNPHDLDILLREDPHVLTTGWRESVLLAVRRMLDPEKTGKRLHLLANPQGPHIIGNRGYVPLYDLVLRPRHDVEIIRDAAPLTPLSRYIVQKPLMAGVTDFVSTQELWERWGRDAAEVAELLVSPKIDGYRLILGKENESAVRAYLEDMEKDYSERLSGLLQELPPGTLVEGELCVLFGDQWLARPQIASYLAGRIDGEPFCFLYDILVYNGEDIHAQPFLERYPLLQKLASEHLVVLPQVRAKTAEELQRAARQMISWDFRHGGPPIEGVVVRRADMPYVFGPTRFYAKWKLVFELKVEVVAVHRKANGWTYTCALRDHDGRLVVLGDTFVTKDKLADVGDTLNVLVEELVLADNGVLSWGKPKPQGVDKSRPAYTVEQALSLAERYGALKRYVDVEKGEENQDEQFLAPDEPIISWLTDNDGKITLAIDYGDDTVIYEIPNEPADEDAALDIAKREKEKRYGPFARSFGSLQPYMHKILPLLPPHVERVVEAFAGQGSLVWHVDPPKGVVLADLDPDTIRLFQICRDLTEDDYKRLRSFKWVGEHEYYRKLYRQPPPEDPIEWFHRQLYLRRFGRDGYMGGSTKIHDQGCEYRWEKRVRLAQERLRHNVHLEVADFRDTMKKYDEPGTLLFLDPPWPARHQRYYRVEEATVEDIAKAIAEVQHAYVMVIIEGRGKQLEPLRSLGLFEKRFAWYHPWSHANHATGNGVQVRTFVSIFTNYEPFKKAQMAYDEDEPRSRKALEHWEQHWQEAMPLSGKPQPFVLHAHIRGLSEEEAQKISDGTWTLADVIRETSHSLHYDLRLATDRGNFWWGITLFAGEMAENRDEPLVFRMQHDSRVKLESAPKLFGPMSWLSVGVDRPLVVPPAGVGSTSKKWAAFFAIDRGTYQLGFARQHAIEIVLQGQHLQGRFLWQYADFGDRRTWLFTRPEDQTLYATKHDFEEIVQEIRRRKQQYLVWPKDPNDLSKGHRLIDVTTIKRVLRSIPEKRYTLAVAFPLNELDAYNDIISSPDELERIAWTFLQRRRKIGLMHQPGTDGAGEVVESYIYRGPKWEVNGEVVEPGDWLLGVVWREDAWERIKRGEFTGYSIQGWGRRVAKKKGESS